MRIFEFEEYISDLTEAEMQQIKEWVKKYEKYFNLHDSQTFEGSVDELTDDCINQSGISEAKKQKVRSHLEKLYRLSDGLSVVMAPDAQFQYTNIDQVQRFQY